MKFGASDNHFFIISEYLEADRKINTPLLKQSPQEQWLLYFFRVYFSYI